MRSIHFNERVDFVIAGRPAPPDLGVKAGFKHQSWIAKVHASHVVLHIHAQDLLRVGKVEQVLNHFKACHQILAMPLFAGQMGR